MFVVLEILLLIALTFVVAEAACRMVVGRSVGDSLRLLVGGSSDAEVDEQSELEQLVARRREELERAEHEAELARQACDLAERLDHTLEALDAAERRLAEAEAKLSVTADLGDHAAIEHGDVTASATHAR